MANYKICLLLMVLGYLAVTAFGQDEPTGDGSSGPAGAIGETGVPGASGPSGQPGQGPCGTVSYFGQGVVTSPSYPANYYNLADCTYFLTASAGGRVQLRFTDFFLESNYDYLTITSSGLTIGRYTGSTLPPVLTLGSSVTLRFTTDSSVVYKGFFVSFSTIPATCGGLIVGGGLIQSPGYPVAYSPNQRCVWGVVATPGQTVTLDFQAFYLEKYYDWLELYDGSTRIARYTGQNIPPQAVLGAAGQVVLTSDSTYQFTGVSIEAKSAILSCGGSITGTVTISSPNYPNSYPNNARCTWTYRVPFGAVATRLTFTDFSLDTNDIVTLCDGEVTRYGLDGTVLPKPIEYRSDTITVLFTSNANIVSRGFRLQMAPVF